uniref:Putative secreted protein n=1 Tax=Anopheles darlingi TaxID=43151 RepID=A0A2M4DB37_ANODA
MQLNGLVILGVVPVVCWRSCLLCCYFPYTVLEDHGRSPVLEENLRTYISSTGHRNTTLQGTERLLLYVVRWY